MEKETKTNVTLEEKLQEVKDITRKLEADEITLEESFQLYEAGVKKIKEISDEIDKVEKKMLMINQEGGLEEF